MYTFTLKTNIMEISKRDLIKFYAYLDNNDYLKDEHKTGKSMTNSIKNFIQYLSQHETSKVETNKEAKEVCGTCDKFDSCKFIVDYNEDVCSIYKKKTG